MESNKDFLELNGCLLVVEGKSDVCFLESFIKTEFFITNGSDLDESKLKYLKNVEKNGTKILVLTDPDFPGEKIRKTINFEIPNSINVFVPKEKCIKGKKLGVAECDKATIIAALKNIKYNKTKLADGICLNDIYGMQLSGSQNASKIRENICKHFNLGYCNTKTMLKRLFNTGVSLQEIQTFLEDCKI